MIIMINIGNYLIKLIKTCESCNLFQKLCNNYCFKDSHLC
jgi:hypothetical protein